MTSQPLISIVIPAFNAAAVLGGALRSVQQQQYPHFQAVVVDDGSSDGTATVARPFVEQDERFVLLQQPNGGVSAARNAGMAAARGAWIAFLDADDMWLANTAGYSAWWLPDAPIRHRIASHRLRVGFHWYSAFASGRSAAAVRLRQRPDRWRKCGLLMGRLVTTPILSLLYLVVALVTSPFRHGQIAVKAMAGAARAMGMLWQLLLNTPGILREGL